MLKEFQEKLRSACRVTRVSEHWIPGSVETVRIPITGEIASLRRAVRAAFVGPLGGGEDVRSSCGIKACVAPDHSTVGPCRGRQSRPLNLSFLDSLPARTTSPKKVREKVAVPGKAGPSAPRRAVPAPRDPHTAPPLEQGTIAQIKSALASGLGVAQVASRFGVPLRRVIAAHNGSA
jgi:hypothetical protein